MPPRPARSLTPLPWLALALLLAAVWLCYLPGLHGGFLFDDFVNLPALGASGPVDNWAAFWRYVTSGTADPTGRPVALLSFLIDAQNWPADPWPFLRTNVLLHLLNTGLLFALLRSLGRWLDGASPPRYNTSPDPSTVILSEAKDLLPGRAPEQKQSRSFAALRMTGVGTASRRTGAALRTTGNDAAALLGAGLWALHPLFVSTTLYIVQREAMLPVAFILAGLLAWLHGRRLLADRPYAGMTWMVLGIGLGTGLAMLCKANGVLLPLLAWVLEATVLRGPAPDAASARRLHWLRIVLLVLPSLAVFAYLLARLQHLGVDLASRPWTLGERLLTEPRVLMDYLRLLVIPRVLSTGLYNDAYVVSTSLLQPATTLPALLAVLALVATGLGLRKRAPAVAAALLFYFGGHLLESTTIGLELYFEHRNYLPALLLGWPLARALCRWQVPLRARGVAAAVLLAMLAAITWQRASLWADQGRMAQLWAAQNPGSSRALATVASFDTGAQQPERAIARLAKPWQQQPDDLQLALNYANAACDARGLQPAEIDAITHTISIATTGQQLLYRWLGNALDAAMAGRCKGLAPETVAHWVDTALANPGLTALPGPQQDMHSLSGRVALARGEPGLALLAFDRALDASPTPQAAARQAALLVTTGAYAEGLAHLDHYAAIQQQPGRITGLSMPRLHDWVLRRQGYWQNELSTLRRNIQADMAAENK